MFVSPWWSTSNFTYLHTDLPVFCGGMTSVNHYWQLITLVGHSMRGLRRSNWEGDREGILDYRCILSPILRREKDREREIFSQRKHSESLFRLKHYLSIIKKRVLHFLVSISILFEVIILRSGILHKRSRDNLCLVSVPTINVVTINGEFST